MSNYWVGVVIGTCVSAILFIVIMLTVIEQNNCLKTEIRAEVMELSEKVAEHDEIMQAYAFYNWQYSLQMREEEKK